MARVVNRSPTTRGSLSQPAARSSWTPSTSPIARLPLPAGGTHYTGADLTSTNDGGSAGRYCSAANSELVFANAVIFVEGEGDRSVVELLLSRICQSPGGHHARGVTVIEAAGLGKIKHLVALAEMFGVRSFVMADGSVRTAVDSVFYSRCSPRATRRPRGREAARARMADHPVRRLHGRSRSIVRSTRRCARTTPSYSARTLRAFCSTSTGPMTFSRRSAPGGKTSFGAIRRRTY